MYSIDKYNIIDVFQFEMYYHLVIYFFWYESVMLTGHAEHVRLDTASGMDRVSVLLKVAVKKHLKNDETCKFVMNEKQPRIVYNDT